MSTEQRPLIERVKKDAAKDKTQADQFKEQADVAALYGMVVRLLEERATLAGAFDSVVQGWTLLRDTPMGVPAPASADSIAAIERIATEAIQFAREVVQAMKPKV